MRVNFYYNEKHLAFRILKIIPRIGETIRIDARATIGNYVVLSITWDLVAYSDNEEFEVCIGLGEL